MSCQRGPSCSKLWCKTRARDVSELCATRHQPWADGTACAAGKACYHKQCVLLSQANPHLPFDESIDGGWSQWSNWSSCSSTCKGGITSSNRLCNNPIPQNGGAECSGKSFFHAKFLKIKQDRAQSTDFATPIVRARLCQQIHVTYCVKSIKRKML